MPSKRRNNGRSKKNRGHTTPIQCTNCARLTPKDKAIKRYMVRDIVDGSSKRDLKDARAYEEHYIIPKLYIKLQYCVSCAIHGRIVRVRERSQRRNRAPPVRVRRDEAGKVVRPTTKAETTA